MSLLNPVFIKGTSLSDAWFQLLYKAVEMGGIHKIDRGSFAGQKRCEFDHVTVHITHPWVEPLIPKLNPQLGFDDPVDPEYIDQYLPYLMTDEVDEKESYTYGSRMKRAKITDVLEANKDKEDIILEEIDELMELGILTKEGDDIYADQMELIIWCYKKHGFRNNQMVLRVADGDDIVLQDPACLLIIDTRIQDGPDGTPYLHFFPIFRSWDLYGGFPANLQAIEMVKQYMAENIGVENGEMICTCKGLHLYDYVFTLAEAIRGRTMDEFRDLMVDGDVDEETAKAIEAVIGEEGAEFKKKKETA